MPARNRLAPDWAKRVAGLAGGGKPQSIKQMILLLSKALIRESGKIGPIHRVVFQ
jgi:hypothetical protein